MKKYEVINRPLMLEGMIHAKGETVSLDDAHAELFLRLNRVQVKVSGAPRVAPVTRRASRHSHANPNQRQRKK